MDMETMFSEQRWNILKCLSQDKFSPLQLADQLNTTIANISQQLRLLEVANLVKNEKIQTREKGKPRKLFSLSHDYAYLISSMDTFSEKKLLELSDHHKIILRIWFLDDQDLHYEVERFYWGIEPQLEDVQFFGVTTERDGSKVVLVSDKGNEFKKNILNLTKRANGKNVSGIVLTTYQAKKLMKQRKAPFSSDSNMLVIYDPNKLLNGSVSEVTH